MSRAAPSASGWRSGSPPPAEASSAAGVCTITVELPGVAEDDIHLSVSAHVLTLQGETRAHREEQGESRYFSERSCGACSRSFRLPPDADGGGVAADLKDGVLTIRVPRRARAPDEEPRRVEIRRARSRPPAARQGAGRPRLDGTGRLR